MSLTPPPEDVSDSNKKKIHLHTQSIMPIPCVFCLTEHASEATMFRSLDLSGRKGSFDHTGQWVRINSQHKLCFCSRTCWANFADLDTGDTDHETEDAAQDAPVPVSPVSQK